MPANMLPSGTRASRAGAARSWLSTVALPQSVRAPLHRLAEATERDAATVASALQAVMSATATYLDNAARLELARLADALAT